MKRILPNQLLPTTPSILGGQARRCVLPTCRHRSGPPALGALIAVCLLLLARPATAATLLDVWRADSINLNDGDTVGTWNSASNRTANGVVGVPLFKRNVTPAGGPAVRFNRNRMAVVNSPVGGRTAFSVALVFRADAVGAGDSTQWYGKTGLIDAEQGGVTADWGTVLTETGNVGIGIGSGDTSLYSTGSSLADSNYHVAVFTWGGGTQSVYVDSRAGISVASPAGARNSAGLSFGGIHTDENGAVRRLVGDMVEIRFYDAALTSLEASNVIDELRVTHILGNVPRIYSFTSSSNQIYLGQSVALAWAVSNATSVVIDSGVGAVSPTNSVVVAPTVTTTYTLTATNANGVRTAFATVAVDPGIPSAFNFSTNTAYNTPVAITLRGSDPQGSNLTYSIVASPAHGTLSGPPPNVSYLPATNYGGLDSFTFKVNDGSFDSAPATVSLNIIPPALPPTGIILSTTNIPSSAGPGAYLAALQAIDVNNLYGDSQTFALAPGGADNAQFTVSGAALFASPAFLGGPGASFNIRLQATDSTGLSYTQDVHLVVFDAPRTVVINEFHYNPAFNPIRESFIELYNDTDATVDLSNWRVRGGVDYFFPANTFMAPHSFVVVADDPATISNRYGVTAFGPWSGGLNNDGDDITLRDALNSVVDNVSFKSEFPWPVAADGNGPSAQLVNPSLDNDLGSSWRSATPTPGKTNSVFATNAAPNIRQVDNTPGTPRSTNAVTITAKVTDPDGVTNVVLTYQVVAPGNYIPATLPLTGTQLNAFNTTPVTNALNSAFELPANWTTVPMHDDGLNGDAVAGDGIYTAVLPQQANRSLVRYRITCTDALGAARRAPFEDDPSLNFAYFVYDGVPNYLGFSSSSLQTLPVYSLITRDVDMNQCAAWFAPFNNGTDQLPQGGNNGARNQGRVQFNWEGAVVYDGKVFDHIHYRLRGANGRYQTGKRSFRIKFNDGALLQPVDNAGKKFPTKWREITTGKGQSNRGGEQFALNEVVSYYLWNKVGTPAPNTFYFHFRVIRGASEAGADQYSGDFWGLNWAQEKYDGRFMDSHNMPKGNLYKLVDNYIDFEDEERYQGTYAPTNGADYFNIQNNLNGFQSISWLNAYANYTNWYRYFTVARAIRHYDTWPSANKNGAWYFEPIYNATNNFLGRMIQMPYDSTDTWGATWNNGDDLLYNGIFASGASGGDQGQHPEMQLDFRNVAREMRSLLFQADQIYQVIDSFAAVAKPVALADAARWSNAPAPASYLSLSIPSSPGVTGGLPAYQQDMKNFMFVGGNNAWWVGDTAVGAGGWITVLDGIIADAAIPNRPTITYAGPVGFPANGLAFTSSAFSDPQGAGTFSAMQWRIAEVLSTNTVMTNPAQLRLEWDAAFQTPELTVFNAATVFPDYAVQAGLRYRARVRHKDDTGRWSAWSLPVEFVAAPADTISVLRTNLVFNEINYNPPDQGAVSGDDFEFVELKNIGAVTLNLGGLFFSQGITFTFTNGTTLAPGGLFLLARKPATLATRYPGVVVNGTYTGKLDNGGETIAISHPTQGEVISITYNDRAPWPVAADGFGFSLVRDATGHYVASAAIFGNPGQDGAAATVGGVVINEVLSNSTLPLKDMIELQNIATNSVDISGWYLTDDPALPQKFRIPNRPPLAPGEFVVFTEDDFNPTPGLGVSFSLSSFGDEVYLFSANALGQLTGYSHGFSFDAAPDGVSFGRYVDSEGDESFPAQISLTFPGTNSGPRVGPIAGPIVINEFMYDPASPNTSFIELFNTSSNLTFDLSYWQINGLSYTFPFGSLIGPRAYLVLAADRSSFAAEYGAAIPVFGTFSGKFSTNGETISLIQPGPTHAQDVIVDRVRYDNAAPWSTNASANGTGHGFQLIDPLQDNSRVGNWSSSYLPGSYTPATNLPGIFYPGSTNYNSRFASVSGNIGSTPRLLLYLAEVGDVYLDDLYLANGNVAETGTNLIVNGDFETPLLGAPLLTNFFTSVGTYHATSVINSTNAHSGSNSLHLISTNNSSFALSRVLYKDVPGVTNGQLCTLSFWYRPTFSATNLYARFQSSTIGSSSIPAAILTPTFVLDSNGPSTYVPPITVLPVPISTPGAANTNAATLSAFPPLWLNEIQTQNLTGPTNSAGQHTAWLELYNAGTNVITLTNLFLTGNYTNLTNWAFPVGATIGPGEFKLIFADGLTGLSTLAELHTSFTLLPGSGSLALSRLYNGQPQVIDYVNYTAASDRSYGAYLNGQSFDRQEFLIVTPRAANVTGLNTAPSLTPIPSTNVNAGALLSFTASATDTDVPAQLLTFSLAGPPSGASITSGGLFTWTPAQNQAPGTNTLTVIVADNGAPSLSATQTFTVVVIPPPRQLTIARPNATEVVLTWQALAGRNYRVEYLETVDAPGAAWTPVGAPLTATGDTLTFTDTIAPNAQRFYRIRLLQP